MAIKKQINIDVNASTAIKTLEELGGSFEDANGEGAIPLSTTIGELEDRLYAMAAAGDTASKEFKEISGQVGKMKKVIIDTDLTLDGMSQNLTQNVGGALTGVASGFSLAQGAMGAFGGGSEAVEESLLKVQSAMAMAQGLQGLKESIGSFKALKKSIMASTVVQKVLNFVMNMNPISKIVLAVVALGAAIALLWSPVKKLLQFMGLLAADAETAAEANKRITATIEAQAAALDKLKTKQAQQHSDRMRQLKLQGASAKEIHEEILKNLKNEEVNRKKSIEDSKKNVKDLQKAWKKALKSGDEENRKSLAEKLNAEKKNVRLLSGQYKQYTLSKQEEDQRYNEKKESDDKAATDREKSELETRISNYKAYLDKKLAAERRIEDLKNSLIKDDEDKALAIRNAKFARDIEDLKTTGKLGNETKRLLEEELQRDLIKITSDAMPDKLSIKTAEIDIEKEGNREILIDYAERAKQQKAIDDQAAEDKKKAQTETALQSADIAAGSFKALGDLATAFAGDSEKAQKRAFKINKAANIAQATIDTFRGAQSAFASGAAINPVVGFVAAAAAVAVGIANIKKIASTQFQGGGGGSVSASAPPSIGDGGGSQPAQFNTIGGTGINQLAQGLGGQSNQPIQTYVVSGDVTTAQGLDRNKIDTATI